MTKIIQQTIITNQKHVDIWLLFDRHFGKKECNYRLLKQYEKYFSTANNYIIIGGDMCEFAESSRNRVQYLKGQKYSDEYQWDNLEEFINSFYDKNLIYISGNHEDNRITNQPSTPYNPFKSLCDSSSIPFSSTNEYLDLRIKTEGKKMGQRYLFYLSHGMSGAQTDDYILRSLQYQGIISDRTDFIVVGHSHHNLPNRPYYRNVITSGGYGLNLTTKTITGIRPGSFLTTPKYMGKGAPRPVPEGNIILRLFADSKRFQSFTNLNELKLSD